MKLWEFYLRHHLLSDVCLQYFLHCSASFWLILLLWLVLTSLSIEKFICLRNGNRHSYHCSSKAPHIKKLSRQPCPIDLLIYISSVVLKVIVLSCSLSFWYVAFVYSAWESSCSSRYFFIVSFVTFFLAMKVCLILYKYLLINAFSVMFLT